MAGHSEIILALCENACVQTQESGEPQRPNRKKPPTPSKTRKHATINERLSVLDLHIKGVSQTEIARITGFRQQRISDIISKHEPTTSHALGVLKAASYQAAVDWVASFRVAVKRGEHRPMRDALIATGVVAPDPLNQGVTVVIGAGDAGVMLQTHSSSSNPSNTLPSTSHNPAHDILIPRKPL